MTRRANRTLLSILFLFILTVSPAIASERNTYNLDAEYFSISLPADSYVLTASISEKDPILEILELSKEEVLDYLAGTEVCLDSFDSQFTYEVQVKICDGNVTDFLFVSDDSLKDIFIPATVEVLEDSGFEILNSGIYESPSMRFINIYAYDSETGFYYTEFSTVYQGKLIYIFFNSLLETPGIQEQEYKKIVDSLTYDWDRKELDEEVQTESALGVISFDDFKIIKREGLIYSIRTDIAEGYETTAGYLLETFPNAKCVVSDGENTADIYYYPYEFNNDSSEINAYEAFASVAFSENAPIKEKPLNQVKPTDEVYGMYYVETNSSSETSFAYVWKFTSKGIIGIQGVKTDYGCYYGSLNRDMWTFICDIISKDII